MTNPRIVRAVKGVSIVGLWLVAGYIALSASADFAVLGTAVLWVGEFGVAAIATGLILREGPR